MVFDFDDTSFQAWHTLPSALNMGAPLPPPYIPSSAIYNFSGTVQDTVSDYNVFKEDCLYHSWHHHLLTTERSHNIDNILKLPTHLLLLMKSHFFKNRNVLSSVSSRERFLPPLALGAHSNIGDATAVYSNLVEHYYHKYSAALLSVSKMNKDLTAFYLDDTWKQSILMSMPGLPGSWTSILSFYKLQLSHINGFGLSGLLHPSLFSPCLLSRLKPPKS